MSDCFFDDVEYFLKDVGNKKRRAYTFNRMLALDTDPTFPDGAEIAAKSENGEVSISFPEASGYYRAENYKIILSRNGDTVDSRVVLSDYTRAVDFEKTVNFGELEAGQYTVKIYSFSPYARRGETLEWGFSVTENGKVEATATDVAEVKK